MRGDWEYCGYSLEREYGGEVDKGVGIEMGGKYYGEENGEKGGVVGWGSVGKVLLWNWLKYYVYEESG